MPKERTDAMRRAATGYYQRNKELVKAKARQRELDNLEKARERATAWRTANPEKRQEISLRSRLKRKYGISVDIYFDMLAKQDGVCAVCKQPETNTTASNRISTLLAVDHNHENGNVRGLLCKGCNLAIGSMQELPERLEAAATYLREHNHDSKL